MAYEFHYTPTGTGAISGTAVLEQTEDAINDLGNTAISGVQEALDKAQQAFTNSANAVDDAQTALNTANNAEGVAIQAQNDVSNLSGTVTNIGNRVTTAEGNIGNLQGRMTTAEGNIGNLQGRMTTAEGDIGNLQTAVSTAQATANSAQQTATTARQQSYVFRYSSTALVASSTNSNTLLDNTDNLKVGDKVIDSSGVLFSITAIDTANSTFTIGTALIDLAQDSDVVHKSGNETISGNKTFSSNVNVYNSDSTGNVSNIVLKNSKAEVGTEFSEQSINFVDKNNNPLAKINCYGSSGNFTRLYITAYDANNNSEGFYIRKSPTGTSILPTTAAAVALGNSSAYFYNVQTNRVNTLEPSSLSLPSDRSARIDISSYFTNTGSGYNNDYDVSANGYIFLNLSAVNYAMCYSLDSSSITNYAQSFSRMNDGQLYIFFPVRKNDRFRIIWYSTGGTITITNAYFIPCQGNV